MPASRTAFTANELAQIRALLRAKETATSQDQKQIRKRLRALGFYISHHTKKPGFTEADLETLLARGTIRILP